MLEIWQSRVQQFTMIQGQARGYGHITQKECCPKWANTSKLNNWKMAEYIFELFQDMKIWDICGHLKLGLCIFIQSSWNKSILKKVSNFCFGAGQKNVIFRKT